MYLSVIVPAYNEEKRLSKTLFNIDAYLKQQNYEYEIIAVDDGSTDTTVSLVKDLQPHMRNLQVIENKINHGKGYVTRQGLLAATGEYRLFTDADSSTSIEQIEKFLPELKNYDIVIASRRLPGAVLDPPQTFLRTLDSKIFKLMLNTTVFLPGIRDTQCGFKLLSAKATQDILSQCHINGWVFDVEILKLSRKMGYKIKELPVVWKNDVVSHVRYSQFFHILFDLVRIRWNLWMNVYGLKK